MKRLTTLGLFVGALIASVAAQASDMHIIGWNSSSNRWEVWKALQSGSASQCFSLAYPGINHQLSWSSSASSVGLCTVDSQTDPNYARITADQRASNCSATSSGWVSDTRWPALAQNGTIWTQELQGNGHVVGSAQMTEVVGGGGAWYLFDITLGSPGTGSVVRLNPATWNGPIFTQFTIGQYIYFVGSDGYEGGNDVIRVDTSNSSRTFHALYTDPNCPQSHQSLCDLGFGPGGAFDGRYLYIPQCANAGFGMSVWDTSVSADPTSWCYSRADNTYAFTAVSAAAGVAVAYGFDSNSSPVLAAFANGVETGVQTSANGVQTMGARVNCNDIALPLAVRDSGYIYIAGADRSKVRVFLISSGVPTYQGNFQINSGSFEICEIGRAGD
jgi:hypothetical protein